MSPEQTPDPPERAADASGRPEPAAAELERLRAEVAELRDRSGTERRRAARLLTVRRVVAAVLIALVAVVSVTSVVGVWGARTTLNTDRWVAAVGPLPEDPDVNKAVSTYLADEIFDQLDVEQRLSEALPPRASFLAAPVTGAVHDYMRKSVSKLIATDEFQAVWRGANRFAHERIVSILDNSNKTVQVRGDTVTLNLLPIVNNLLNSLEQELPTVFGKKLDLPTLKSGEIPPGLHQRIETALGVDLPENFAQIRLYDRHELGQLQQAVLVFKKSLVGLLIAVPVLLALSLWVSPNRRRTVLQLGLWLVVSVTVLSTVLRAVREQLLHQVPEGVYRDGLQAALWTIFTTLRDRGDQLLWLGVGIAVLAYLVGPGRLPTALRRYTAQGARAAGQFLARAGERAAGDRTLRPWLVRHVDVLRVGGAVVAVLVALLLSSWTALFVVGALLAAYEIALTLLARADGGSPPSGEAGHQAPAKTGASG
ncbi:hypothetical protein OKJ48_06155 [Streptomyces kunmingensis]|uniref:Integral membrane protein n=1 Tax=Streptomyces kunmingensis TaxID=68225 RepID=A0ABU6C534_9ACTN|nr:hypothetical protein [Streptomyces kunmingensis]MEB3959834.1 hypothetical protein [Streptomyces kunmingensis]